ncbi:hypothetical protein SCUCBS95973_008258 [Sporothrix curviconia]|uniref:Proteophosphoglycan 5 n=1 Tax=Sporothrix curviconia TaxID=1260050 RepID=A0ABP0CK56_9PEZI
MPSGPRAKAIATLDSLAGQSGQDDALEGDAALAAALQQLTDVLNQTAAASLPRGTHVDYTAIVPAAPVETDAFQGPGRVLGRMYGSKSKSADSNNSGSGNTNGIGRSSYNLRPHHGASASSRRSGRGSGSSVGGHDAAGAADGQDDPNDDNYVDRPGSRRGSLTTQTTHTAIVMSDDVGEDGVRRVEMQLAASPKPVTVVLPQANGRKPGQRKSRSQSADKSSGGHLRKKTTSDTATSNAVVLPPSIHLPKTPPSPKLPTPESEAHSPIPPTPILEEAPPTTFRRDLRATVEDVEDIDPKALRYFDMDDTVAVAPHDAGDPVQDRLTPELPQEGLGSPIPDDDDGDSDVYGEDWFGENLLDNAEADEPPPATQHLSDTIDRNTVHMFRGHEQPSVGERLEQALAYFTSQSAARDPQRHERLADLEAYLDFLEGVERPNDSNAETGGTYAGVDSSLLEALARAEAEEAEAAANDQTSTLEHFDDGTSLREQPPVIYRDNTRRLLQEVRRQIKATRDFYDLQKDGSNDQLAQPVSVPPSAGGEAGIQSPSLRALLQTWGRSSFAGRLISNFEAAQLPGAGLGHSVTNAQGANQDETHPYTVQMARYRQLRRHWMQEARNVAEHVHGNTPGWATLPPFEGAFSLGLGRVQQDGRQDGRQDGSSNDTSGVVIPREPLPASMEQDRHLLALLRSLGRLLPHRLDVAPRPLLEEVQRYIEQGLRGDALPDASLQLRDGYDYHARQRSGPAQSAPETEIRRINETEARWLQFLLSDSTNEALAAPLPAGPHLEEDPGIDPADAEAVEEKTLEEGSRALYHVFAQRLQALMNDRSSSSVGGLLFRTAEMQAPVTALVHALNSQSGNGTTMNRTQFSIYDTLHFLSRLSRAGRCRFTHHPFEPTHGFVQRPLLTIHPEHRVHPSWLAHRAPDGTDIQDDADAAIGAPLRDYDVDASWADTVASGRAAQGVPLSADVRAFFCALAFRLGRTLRELEVDERPRWEQFLQEAEAGIHNRGDAMRASIRTWHRTYEALLHQHNVRQEAEASGIPTSLVDVVRLADPETFAEKNGAGGPSLTEKEARAIISKHMLAEAASGRMTPNRQGLWEWASPAIAGQAPVYFHMDRWPLHLQTQETAARVADEARIALDPEILWDPASEDPASTRYMWLFSGPGYGYQRTRETHTQYLLGDTALQRQVLVQDLTRRVAAEAGIDMEDDDEEGNGETRGFLGWMGAHMPFGKRKRDETEDNDEAAESGDEDGEERARKKPRTIVFRQTPLPEVTDIPRSVNWVSRVMEFMNGYRGEEDHEDGRGEDDEDGWVGIEDADDIAME